MSANDAETPVPPEIPDWDSGDLPIPRPRTWRDWPEFIGPGIVMMGMQIGGGEWLFGPEVTARYGGGLMWIATVAIVLQVFYNLECGRYALACGEPVFTGFMRLRPGARFWMALVFLLGASALIPGLSTHGAAMAVSLYLDRPPQAEDAWLVNIVSYVFVLLVALPVLLGGKVYRVLQVVSTIKVFGVLGFCLLMGILFVSPGGWWNIFSGFLKFGTIPTPTGGTDQGATVNLFQHWWETGAFPVIALGNLAALGGFAGYAGGGGLGNSTYSNFVRDQGWGMGSQVGAIPSAVGGRHVRLSHVGKIFAITPENLARWKGWWRYILLDQFVVWAPGCFMGMALPALLSIQFASYSELKGTKLAWSQSLITADGVRHAPGFSPMVAQGLWVLSVLVGLLVMMPSQMSIVDDFCRRWTDVAWSGSKRVRSNLSGGQVRYIYYGIMVGFVAWSYVGAFLFNRYGNPRLMTIVIANCNNLAIGVTSFLLLRVNTTRLPEAIRPRWYFRVGLALCGVFYVGLGVVVLLHQQVPALIDYFKG